MLRSKLPDVDIPDKISITQFVLQNVEKHKDDIAFVDVETQQHVTYQELAQQIQSVGSALYRRGLRKGDVLLIFLPNCLEYPTIFHAVVGQGAIVTPCNPLYTTEELIGQLEDSQAVFIFTHSQSLEKVNEALQSYGNIKEVFLADNMGGYVSFTDLCTDDGEAFPQLDLHPREDTAILPYSSGTAGKPKAVLLTHYNLIANCAQIGAPEFALSKQHRFLLSMPLFHIYGIFGFLMLALRTKSMTAMMPRFEFEQFLTVIQKYKPTYLHTVPPICVKLAKSPLVDKFNMTSIETIFCGAAPLSQSIVQSLKERFPHVVNFQQGYGMTELSPVSHCTLAGIWNYGSCGVLIPNTMAKIIDLASGDVLGPNQDGEICVKGPQVMKGYLATSHITENIIDREGWLHTGQIAGSPGATCPQHLQIGGNDCWETDHC